MLEQLRAYKYSTAIITAAAVLLVVISGLVWWYFVHLSPSRVFWGAMENNLRVPSVTKHVTASQGGQNLDQYIRLQLGSTNAADWLVTLKQQNSTVVTESVGTPTTGYVRYIKAATSQKHQDGSAYNFNNVLNVWAKADNASTDSLSQLFSQTILDISKVPAPPIGNLPPEYQQNLLDFMHDQSVFAPDYTHMKRETLDGRSVYVYDVKVSLMPYARMMQAFAHDTGLKDLDNLDPTQFRSAEPVKLRFVIDAAGHQLREITSEDQAFKQTYDSYGLTNPIEIPRSTISVTELQKRLQSL
jgi:hypothetical protein